MINFKSIKSRCPKSQKYEVQTNIAILQSKCIYIDNALHSKLWIKWCNNTTRIVKFRFKKLDVDDLQSLYLLYCIGLKTLQTLLHTMTVLLFEVIKNWSIN